MGRLPSAGIGWYRKKLNIPAEDAGKSIFLDVDGAMSYSTVWLNGRIVGGWPYGYASWRVDLTPYVREDILLEFPRHPLCNPDCRGLPGISVGGSTNLRGAGKTEVGSPAWAELNKLKL